MELSCNIPHSGNWNVVDTASFEKKFLQRVISIHSNRLSVPNESCNYRVVKYMMKIRRSLGVFVVLNLFSIPRCPCSFVLFYFP